MKYNMDYDHKQIGERIKLERKKLINEKGKPYTQDDLAREVREKKAKVISWEKGRALPSLENMVCMCNLFECEIGYLLCEQGYENKTRTTTDICKATGLSPAAVEKLSLNKQMQDIINELIIKGESISDSTIAILYETRDYAAMENNGYMHIYKAIYDEIQSDPWMMPHEREVTFYEMLEDAIEQYEEQRIKEFDEEAFREMLKHSSEETINTLLHYIKQKNVDMAPHYVTDIYKKLDTDYKHREKVYMMDIKDSFVTIMRNYIEEQKEKITAEEKEKGRVY